MEKKLLIVDDSEDILELLKSVLITHYDKIECTQTVEGAISLLKENFYSFVMLDINLDGRNGAEVIKYLVDHPENPNKDVPFVIMSGIITRQFIDRHKNKFAGILIKPFENGELISLVEEILRGQKAEEVRKTWENTPVDEIPNLKCDLPFPILQLETRVNKVLDQVRKNIKLKQFFSKLVIDRSENNYMMTHIGMMVNISTAISALMEWNTDKTLEKFVYASYLHNMALGDRFDLAKIHTFEELEAKKATLTPAEYKIILEHPNIAANSIEELTDIPPDVATMVRQHHENPRETGFPSRCGPQKIPPLSVIFIVSHDLASYILANPNWSIADYIQKSKSKYKGIHFTKVLQALAQVK